MITLNQPGLKSFITYVLSFIFLTLFIYLGIPFFFDYESNKSVLEKKIHNNFGLYLNFTSKAKYNFFPSPRLNLQNVEILSFSQAPKKIGSANEVILRIPFKKLMSLDKLNFDAVDIINAVVNIDTSEINTFKKYLNNVGHEKSIQLKKSKINILEKTNLLFVINSKKINISGSKLFNKVNLRGKIFNTELKINYQNKNFDNNPTANVLIGLPEIGLNLKININTDKEEDKDRDRYGRVNVFFPNNRYYFDYILNNNILNISSSKLINNYYKGQLFGNLIFLPFLSFDLKLDINILKFKNILNSKFIKNNKFLSQLIPINNKINGKLNINIEKIASSSNIINSGNINLEFRNRILIVKEVKFNINKIGNIKLGGEILQQRKEKIFSYNAKINIDNSKNFYSRFLIPKKSRIYLKPINLLGKINLESYEINLDHVYFGNELDKNELDKSELLRLNEKINDLSSQSSLDNILRYSNLRKIIQSFFN